MDMNRTGHRLAALTLLAVVTPIAAIAPALVVPTASAAESAAAAPKLSEAQLRKLIAVIPEKGTVVTANKRVTDTLGLTKDRDVIASRTLTVKERTGSYVHQIQPLPGGQGYLVGKISPTTMEVYWTDKNLVLVAAVASMRGGPATGMNGGMMVYSTPLKEAQDDFGKEVAYWATVADAL
jgi:hypothetical protein